MSAVALTMYMHTKAEAHPKRRCRSSIKTGHGWDGTGQGNVFHAIWTLEPLFSSQALSFVEIGSLDSLSAYLPQYHSTGPSDMRIERL